MSSWRKKKKSSLSSNIIVFVCNKKKSKLIIFFLFPPLHHLPSLILSFMHFFDVFSFNTHRFILSFPSRSLVNFFYSSFPTKSTTYRFFLLLSSLLSSFPTLVVLFFPFFIFLFFLMISTSSSLFFQYLYYNLLFHCVSHFTGIIRPSDHRNIYAYHPHWSDVHVSIKSDVKSLHLTVRVRDNEKLAQLWMGKALIGLSKG